MWQNGDGYVTMEELDANLKPKTRRKIEMCLDKGWKFDEKTWLESVERHKKWNMKEIFAQFDADGDGKLDICLLEERSNPHVTSSLPCTHSPTRGRELWIGP